MLSVPVSIDSQAFLLLHVRLEQSDLLRQRATESSRGNDTDGKRRKAELRTRHVRPGGTLVQRDRWSTFSDQQASNNRSSVARSPASIERTVLRSLSAGAREGNVSVLICAKPTLLRHLQGLENNAMLGKE